MSQKTSAAPLNSFASVVLHLVLCALLLINSIALRTVPDWPMVDESSVLQSDFPGLGFRGPRCGLNPHRKIFKSYYFDLPSADPGRPEDDRAVVLLRDPQNPQLVVYDHAHWRISHKTKNAKLVGRPQWTPVDSATNVQQRKIVIDLYNQTDFVRQSMQDGVLKFEFKHSACSEPTVNEKEATPNSSIAPEKICGLSFAGGTYYPTYLVKAALLKVGSVWKNKEQISFNSSRMKKMDIDVEPSKNDKKMKWIFGLSLFGALAPIPAIYATGTLGPMLWTLGTSAAASIMALGGHKHKMSLNRTTAAEKLFEKIYCLPGACAGRTCMAKCRDAKNEENHVVMPRSRVAAHWKSFTCD